MLPTTNDENCSSTLRTDFGNLSLDIILAIADHLPASSVICLALTCKQLYYSQQDAKKRFAHIPTLRTLPKVSSKAHAKIIETRKRLPILSLSTSVGNVDMVARVPPSMGWITRCTSVQHIDNYSLGITRNRMHREILGKFSLEPEIVNGSLLFTPSPALWRTQWMCLERVDTLRQESNCTKVSGGY
ncbi:hypothetical protein KCU83_g216, partial [Aureobasidium melanogenum]